MSYSDKLIHSNEDSKKAFGFAIKAYDFAMKSNFSAADTFFKKSLSKLESNNQKGAEVKSYVLYLQSQRYFESHEVETAIRILIEAIHSCNEKCVLSLEIKLQSALARAYSLSGKVFKALEISNYCLTKIKNSQNYIGSKILRREYTKELVKAANRSMNVYYYLDREKYKSYLDSTQHYITLAKNYAEKHQISNYNGTITLVNASINFYKHNYKISKQYCQEGLKIFQKRKRKKRIAQILFQIARCDFYLKNWDNAATIFQQQLQNNTWAEFQLFSHEARCHFYLFKIAEQRKQPEKALVHANKYVVKFKKYLEVKNTSFNFVNDVITNDKRKKEIEAFLQKYELQKRKKNIFLYALLSSIGLISILILYFFSTKKRNKKNIELLHSRIKELEYDVNKQNIPKATQSLTDENALILIEKLKKLEKEELFLKSNYTLTLAAKKLNTNSSYLSQTLNNYLNITFTEYSNKLRIHSITKRLREQKNLRNYTIEALAQEAGYKSIGSFNSNFKKLLKITPSQYIKELKRTEK